jgi:protein-disulfide isomerase
VTNARATREARQEKLASLRAAEQRRQRQRRAGLVTAVVVVLVVVVVAVFVLIQNSRRDTETSGASTPGNVGNNNSFVVGSSGAPVPIVAYEDFQCPVCAQFESENAAQIDAWVKAGTVKVEYRPIAFLDRMSSTEYSTRSLNAAAAVQTYAPASFATFHQLLFRNQPPENGSGLTDAKLTELAKQAGATQPAVAAAIRNRTYEKWTAKVTEDASKAGVQGTPTVQVAGQTLKSPDAASMKAAVDAAVAAAKK